MAYSETRRQLVRMATAVFAVSLRALAWWEAAACALAALLFNVFLLPRFGGQTLYRPVDHARGYALGVVLYPLAVLLLILLFPARPDIVAAAWGILALGRGTGALVGQRGQGTRLPWNGDRTIEGLVAFVAAGGGAGILLAWWTSSAVDPRPAPLFIVAAPLAAALLAGLVDTIPVRLDGNLSVPAAAAAVLWAATLVTGEASETARGTMATHLLPAVLLNGPLAALGWRVGALSAGGSVAGGAIGLSMFVTTGGRGWVMLFTAFIAATASSRFGLKEKALLGIAEEHGGRRGAGNALANCLIAVGAGLLANLTPHLETALLVLVAALTAAGSDTVASELGKAWAGRTYLIPSFARVRPGCPGGVSLQGTAAGLVAAFAMAAIGFELGLINARCVWFVVAGATVGSLVESWLAGTLEAAGVLNNGLLNFINTAAAAVVAVLLAGAFV